MKGRPGQASHQLLHPVDLFQHVTWQNVSSLSLLVHRCRGLYAVRRLSMLACALVSSKCPALANKNSRTAVRLYRLPRRSATIGGCNGCSDRAHVVHFVLLRSSERLSWLFGAVHACHFLLVLNPFRTGACGAHLSIFRSIFARLCVPVTAPPLRVQVEG